MKTRLFLLLAFVAISSAFAPAYADDDDDDRERHMLDVAVERGDVLPLSQILEKVGSRIEGRILEIEFEYSRKTPIYEIYVLTPEGRRMEYEIDARTARILSFEDDD